MFAWRAVVYVETFAKDRDIASGMVSEYVITLVDGKA